MDAAYDARQIGEQSQALGHLSIINRNPRRKEAPLMNPHEARRYNKRSSAEIFNGGLKTHDGDFLLQKETALSLMSVKNRFGRCVSRDTVTDKMNISN